jgi:hypothetical protein
MTAKKDATEDFDLGFTAEEFEQLQPNLGLGFRRVMFGDYTFEIVGTAIQPTKGSKKPHNMLKVTARVVAAADEANKNEIGSEMSNLYGGSPQSPDFMKQRLKALCIATGVNPTKGGKLMGSAFIGKRFDASVVWELSKSDKLDDFGKPKMYVNDRIKGERKVGAERPQMLNPVAESQKAKQYADGDTAGVGGEAAPWDAAAGGEGGDVGGEGGDTGTEAGGFVPEDQVDAIAHAYRAVVALGGDDAAGARETLIGAGYDPDGPVNVEMIDDADLKKAYLAKFPPEGAAAPKKAGGLPPLNGAGRAKTGTRAPAAAR